MLNPNTPFIVFGDDWDRYPSTMQHIFRHIAARHPVLWINGIGHRVPRVNLTDARRAAEKLWRNLRAKGQVTPVAVLGPGVPRAVVEPRVLPWHNHPLVGRLNRASLRRSITAATRRLGLTSPPVLVTGSPPSAGLVGALGELASVYFVLDDYLNFPTYTASMLAPLEAEMLRRVDMVVATAASLTVSKRPASARAFHLPQGVNYEHFSAPRPAPADLEGIRGPRIGFAGTVSTQCDVELIRTLAERFPGAAVVLVGPVRLPDDVRARLTLPNVHLLGVRPYAELPAYVQHFDAGIIPYVISAWTVAVDPLKLLEYLAGGIPVVCTAIPEAAKYADVVAVRATHEEFVAAVGAALDGSVSDTPAQRRSFASRHGWNARADTFLRLVEGVIADRRGAKRAS